MNFDYQEKLKELEEINNLVKLSKNPLTENLDYFNEKFYEIQSARDRILSILVNAIWNKALLNSELSELQSEYESKLSQILVRDDVKPLKSNELRLAVANNELTDLVQKIKDLERKLMIVEAYYKTIVIYYDELKAKNENLAQQFLTVRAMLNIEPSLKETILKITTK